ncbi:DMT family transporter [Vibrio mangrovi]|uniref:DMT family transporter n=1 Tax=Vibrio mangrovi TaxID=474394 RepID=A0A1Y6IXD2_9VIBR|nr:DMT family transporter [Vibrio mangrovi]MDW6002813.1 DMT family transporter [Vibrio mangrovi]SMS02304.1 EamA-like transporter family protein [Vibrio mangrovi]
MLSQEIVRTAIILLILGNLAASLSDVAVKALDGSVSPFQYMFLRQLLSVVLTTPFWLFQPKEKRVLTHFGITLIRSHLILIGSGCMVVAITYLSLATANAVFYAAPLLMLPLSIWLLREYPTRSKVLKTLIGFCGVLIVLRPSQFHWAALFALGTAITLALFQILVRKLPTQQTLPTTLFWTSLFSLPVAAVLAFYDWHTLDIRAVGWIGISAMMVLAYNGLAVAAYRLAPANQIAIAEYSGLILVILLGWGCFGEIPTTLSIIGIGLIVIPLMSFRSIRSLFRLYLLRPKPPLDKRKNITD